MDLCPLSAWDGSWDDPPNNPSATGAISAMACAIGAASALGAGGLTSCKRQVSGSHHPACGTVSCDSCGENLSDDPRSGGFLFGRGARPSGGKPFCPWTCPFGITFGMPRADRIGLTARGLAMPPVDHLSNKGTLNVLLDRAFSGGFPRGCRRTGR